MYDVDRLRRAKERGKDPAHPVLASNRGNFALDDSIRTHLTCSPGLPMNRILFTDVNVLDGSGEQPFRGRVLVEGNRIAQVVAGQALVAPNAQVVDGRGGTLMPGLIESHSHLTFLDMARSIDLGFVPPEEHMLMTVVNAKRLLDAGFTSCLSAASAKPRLDVVLRNAVDAGDFPGPRTLAASPEMTVTAGLGDVRLRHLFRQNFAEVLDGPLEFRRFSREMVREGVDTLKINISGDAGTVASPSRATVMTEAEVDAVCDVARAHGKRVAAHVRNGESVRMALRHGVDILYHGNLVDDEACAALEAQKDRIFFAPTIGHTYTTLYEALPWGITTEMGKARGLDQELERGIANMKALKQRGVRVEPQWRERPRSRALRETPRFLADRGDRRRHEARRRTDDARRRPGSGEDGLRRGPAAGGWGSASGRGDSPGCRQAGRNHEGRRVSQECVETIEADEVDLCPPTNRHRRLRFETS